MTKILNQLKAIEDIDFEKCGEIIWAPKRNVFACCCWNCDEFFMRMPALMRHVRMEHAELFTSDEEDEEGITWAASKSAKEFFSYTVEELLAGEGDETAARRNSCYLCEEQGDQLLVSVRDSEVEEKSEEDGIIVEYTMDEVNRLLEAEQLLSETEKNYPKREEKPFNVQLCAGQMSADSGFGLESSANLSTNNADITFAVDHQATDNIRATERSIIETARSAADLASQLVDTFYKNFKPKSRSMPLNIPIVKPMQVKGKPPSNAFKIWDVLDQNITKIIQTNDDTNEQQKQKPPTTSATNKCISPTGSSKDAWNVSGSDSVFSDISKLSSNNEFVPPASLAQLKGTALAQSTPKDKSGTLENNKSNLSIENQVQTTPLKNSLNRRSILKSSAEIQKQSNDENGSVLLENGDKKKMLQIMRNIKKRLLLVDMDKENEQRKDIQIASKKFKLAMPPKDLKAATKTQVPSAQSTASVEEDKKDEDSNMKLSIEILQSSKAPIVNLSAFDCVLNDETANATPGEQNLETSTESGINYKPDDSKKQIKAPNLNVSIDGLQLNTSELMECAATSSSHLDVSSHSDANATVDILDDLKLLEEVGLKSINNPSLEAELPLATVNAMRIKAFRFADFYKSTSYLWLQKPSEIRSNDEIESAFGKLLNQTNAITRHTLTVADLKRILNLINIWYSHCNNSRLMRKKAPSKITEFYLLLFAFLPRTGRRHFYCEYCTEFFRNETRYTKHRTEHTGSKPYRCQNCKRGFVRRKSMQTHVSSCTVGSDESHQKTMKYICEECGTKCASERLWKLHLNTHKNIVAVN